MKSMVFYPSKDFMRAMMLPLNAVLSNVDEANVISCTCNQGSGTNKRNITQEVLLIFQEIEINLKETVNYYFMILRTLAPVD